jgi:hypothetical protein
VQEARFPVCPKVSEHEIVRDAEIVERRSQLERAHDPAPHALLRCEARHVHAVVENRALVGREIPGEKIEERRLPSTIRADDARDFVLAENVVDAVDGRQRTKAFGDADGA